ncbi:FAD/NAD(P)-binding domain-containing protein [Cadophora sp. DSE1049]|nr:FAD/NAD(P)-binding domain-containing protein [Cadophora sp. DSE1049]
MASLVKETTNGADPRVEKPANWAPILDQPINTPRKLRVVCVGAGFGGLSLAYEIQHTSDWGSFLELQIYDKNPDIGGTWYENRYPGAACDVPSHVYVFPFEPNPDWSSYYAGSAEIFQYIKKTAAKWALDKFVSLNSTVTDTTWNEDSCKWRIKIVQEGRVIEDECDILVSASGLFNKWSWPDIDGLHSFKGKLLHTADWDTSYDWTGKKVAVIGNGSSAIQVVPKVRKTAKELVNYFRNPTWVVPNLLQDVAEHGITQYSEERKKEFRENPESYFKFRKNIENNFNKFFLAMINGTPKQKEMEIGARMIMEGRLGNDPELIKRFVPTFNVGCRRLSPGDGYLEALQESNVRSISDPIIKVTENGILTADGEENFDLIVAATGFDYSFRPKWNQVGRNGARLREMWKEDATSYFGMCAVDQPNYFIYTGPNAPVSHGNSLLYSMQVMTSYILRWCRKIATQDIRSVSVKASIVDDLDVWSQASLQRTVWAGECRSWFKGGKVSGKITSLHAGSGLHYRAALDEIRGEDFEIAYWSPNRFRYLGNGLTKAEVDGDEELAFYLVK